MALHIIPYFLRLQEALFNDLSVLFVYGNKICTQSQSKSGH